jgi:phosphomannomutase
MAQAEGFLFEETLTGFKWLGNRALQMNAQPRHVALMAFEEAIGEVQSFSFNDSSNIN